MPQENKNHWEAIYQTKAADQVSWFKPRLSQTFQLLSQANVSVREPILDVGGGASTLVDDLLKKGFGDITILDISSEALEVAKKRLGSQAQKVKWLISDITTADLLKNHYALWHDRAVFHFLIRPEDRRAYVNRLNASLKQAGHAILSTFSLTGPERCSGLEVVRYSPEKLAAELGENFQLIKSFDENHQTPLGTTQAFIYCYFIKK